MQIKYLKLISLIFLTVLFTSCTVFIKSNKSNPTINSEATILSEISTANQYSLSRKDIVKLFCNNLTEYFNAYKYYNIFSEVYYEKDKQNDNTITKIIKKGSLYIVEYIGAAGRYVITFSNNQFSNSEQIYTFGRQTVLGNAIRSKVYDTFVAWTNKEEIALKSNYNSYLYSQELSASVEIENWFNNLSFNGNSN